MSKAVQTTLLGGSLPRPSQKNSQITQHKDSQQSQITPQESPRKPDHTPRSHEGPYDFLLNGWSDYFGDGSNPNFNDQDFRHVLILLVFDSFDDKYYEELYDWRPEQKHSLQEVHIDFKKISDGPDDLLNEMFSLFDEYAVDFIPAISMALEKIRVHKLKKPKKEIVARFFNVNKFCSINDIESSMMNQYVSIKGTVLKTSPIKLLMTGITFQCLECKTLMARRFSDGIFTQPTSCDNNGCKSKIFIPDKTTSQSILSQRVRVQEINDNSGRLPKSIECELKESLVSRVVSGDVVVVNGVLKTERAKDSESRAYVDANTVTNVKYKDHSDDDEFSEDDMKIIEDLANTRNIFPLLVRSFCPTIRGQELVKARIILAIVGDSNLKDSPDSHILIIGDPGQGKSQMLKFVSNIVPRGVYVCGNAISNAGLTIAVTKDAHTGEGSLEAGALVLSDQDVCCIDEFDKMSSEDLSLLEAMEQQTVSIAKSGVMCSLFTRTTIVAAANPKGGHYNKSKNVKDNIEISNALLSRFDHVFLLLDHRDLSRDQKLSEHVMKLHDTKKRKRDQFENYEEEKGNNNSGNITFAEFPNKFHNKFYAFKQPNNKSQFQTDTLLNDKLCSLTERLTKICDQLSQNQVIDQSIFQKYVAYIQKNVHPYLTPEAGEVIKAFFISLRENNDSNPSLTTTTRQLESLIRLSQARAKLECRTKVTKEDAMEVVDLMQESLFYALEDLSGGSGVSMSAREDEEEVDSDDEDWASQKLKATTHLTNNFKIEESGQIYCRKCDAHCEKRNLIGHLTTKCHIKKIKTQEVEWLRSLLIAKARTPDVLTWFKTLKIIEKEAKELSEKIKKDVRKDFTSKNLSKVLSNYFPENSRQGRK